MDEIAEQAAHLEQLISTLRRRERVLQSQRARFDAGAVPAQIVLELEDLTQEIAQRTAELRRLRPDIASGQNPYLGLLTFQETDAERFFGRDALIAELVERAGRTSFLAVLGASGSGKSSVVRAGLIPMLKGGAIVGSERWRYITLRPGARPLDMLAAELARLQGGDLDLALRLRTSLAEHANALLLAAKLLLNHAAGQRFVLVVDQTEELWTNAPGDERARFVDLLLTATDTPDTPLLVVLAMRADFLHRALEYAPLGKAITEHDVSVSPMSEAELGAAIVRPAELAGGSFEPGLVDELIKQTRNRPGALPLLEFTLQELWKRHTNGHLTWDAYRALGGLEGALAARADALFAEHYPEPEQQDALRAVLLRLVQPGEGAEDTRRRVAFTALAPASSDPAVIEKLIAPLVQERLLTTGIDASTQTETLEVAHEALIRAWPTFRAWIDAARADLRFQLQLEGAAQEWQSGGEDDAFLWSGLRLTNAEAWLARTNTLLNARDRAFLDRSRAAAAARDQATEGTRREREALIEARATADRRNVTRLRVFLAVGSVLLATALVFLYFALSQQRAANRAAKEAQRAADIARSQARAAEALLALTNGDLDRATILARASIPTNTETYEPLVFQAIHRTLEDVVESRQLTGHSSTVEGGLWSKDETRVLTWSADATARIWDVATGKTVQIFAGHTSSVRGALWSKDETRILTWSDDKTIRVWDVATGKTVQIFAGHTSSVRGAFWSKNETRVLSWSGESSDNRDNTIRIWDEATGKALQVLRGHTSSVSGALWSKDETRVLSWSGELSDNRDNTVRIWDVATGKAIQVFRGHTFPVQGAGWSNDETRVLSWGGNYYGNSDNSIHIWDVATGKAVQVLRGHASPIQGASWSKDDTHVLSWSADNIKDDTRVLSSSVDNTIRIWDVATGKAVQLFEGHAAAVEGASWSKDETRVLSWSVDNTIRIWDVATGHAVQVLRGHTSYIQGVLWSKDETRVLSWSADKTIRIWDVETGHAVQVLQGHTSTIQGASWNKDETRVLSWGGDVIGGSDNSARIWNVATGQAVQVLQGHTSPIQGASWSKDETRILSWTWGGEISDNPDTTIRIWDEATGKALQVLRGHTSFADGASWSKDDTRVLSWSGDKTIRIWDVATGKCIQIFAGHTSSVRGALWSKDETRVLSWSNDKTIRIWDVATGQALQVLQGHTSSIQGVSRSKNESYVLSWSGDLLDNSDNTIRVWDVATGKAIQVFRGHTSSIQGASWSKDETRVLSWSDDKTIRVWDVATGKTIQIFAGHTSSVRGALWSKDETRVLSWSGDIIGSLDNTVRVWDVATGKVIQVFRGHTFPVRGASWSNDETRVLSWGGNMYGNSDNIVRVWNVTTGKAMQVLEGHTSPIQGASWSKDGTRVLSWSDDKTVRIWDVATGKAVQVLQGHTAAVQGASWSKDETRVLSWSVDNTVRVWEIDPHMLVAELTNRVCHLGRSDAELANDIPSWRGCATELAAADVNLKEYQARFRAHPSGP